MALNERNLPVPLQELFRVLRANPEAAADLQRAQELLPSFPGDRLTSLASDAFHTDETYVVWVSSYREELPCRGRRNCVHRLAALQKADREALRLLRRFNTKATDNLLAAAQFNLHAI